jgi:polyhydroxyalkanoate synthesis regulator phasin
VFQLMMIVALLSTGFGAIGGARAMGEPSSSTSQSAPAQEAWQKEFDDICSKTQDAMTFSPEELASLLSRCDALLPQIEKLDATRKKVYQGRLRMCRGFYRYVLDSKQAIGEPSSSTSRSAPAQEAWQKEFDDICSKTQDAMTFSQEDLASLISRCDALLPKIEKLDETRKKVYLGRLRMCRGFYANVLNAKRNEKK